MRFWWWLAISGCSTEYGLSSRTGAVGTSPSPPRTSAAPNPPHLVAVSTRNDGGSATLAWQGDDGSGVEEFEVGPGSRTTISDWLFVLDPSSSMVHVVDRVQTAFADLSQAGVFPDEARVAILATTPSDPSRFGHLNAAVRQSKAAKLEPGFAHLVSSDRIAAFRAGQPGLIARFPAAGCDAWFAPTAVDVNGIPCFVGNTQISATGVRAEAGLTALAQWLTATDHPFRAGAAVNVVFVSDTHDPGTDDAAARPLIDDRPTAADLADLAERDAPLAAFRLHAVAPATECVEKWADGATYYDAVQQSGGWTVDLCTATDFRPLIRKIADEGSAPQQAVVALGRDAVGIAEVTADGAPVGYTPSADGRALILDLPADRAGTVEVRYHPPRAAPRTRVPVR